MVRREEVMSLNSSFWKAHLDDGPTKMTHATKRKAARRPEERKHPSNPWGRPFLDGTSWSTQCVPKVATLDPSLRCIDAFQTWWWEDLPLAVPFAPLIIILLCAAIWSSQAPRKRQSTASAGTIFGRSITWSTLAHGVFRPERSWLGPS